MGWKSGKPHEIEIWFVEHNSKFYLVAELRNRSHWVQNIKHDSKVNFKVGDSKFKGRARVVEKSGEAELSGKVSALMDAKYKWSEGLIVELRPSRSAPSEAS